MRRAFTLIELMIVVAIIAIVAAIAIPNLLESRKAANESSIVGCLRTYAAGQYIYQKSDYARYNGLASKQYCPAFNRLGGPAAHVNGSGARIELISPAYAAAIPGGVPFFGYLFRDSGLIAGAQWSDQFGLYADPSTYKATGLNSYTITTDGVVYMKDCGAAGSGGSAVVDATWVIP